MKFTVQQADLKEALSNLIRVINPKFDCYRGVKITKTDNKHITLQTLNGTMVMRQTIEAENIGGDCEVVEAGKFLNIINKLSGVIKYNDGEIKAGMAKLKLEMIQTDIPEYPLVEGEGYVLEASWLKEAIKNRLYAVDTISTGVLSGLYLNKNDIVSTNGNLLSISKLQKDLPFKPALITKQFAEEILKCFRDDDVISLTFGKNNISAGTKNIYVQSQLLVGQYPHYEGLMPKGLNTVEINKTELLNKLDLLSTMVNDKTPTCKLVFNNNVLNISVQDGEDVMLVTYAGEAKEVYFNINYLINSLKNINGDVISIGLNASLAPWLLQNDNEQILIMPIQVNK